MPSLKLAEKEKIELLADGVKDPSLRRFILDTWATTVPEFIEHIRKITEDNVARRPETTKKSLPTARSSSYGKIWAHCKKSGHTWSVRKVMQLTNSSTWKLENKREQSLRMIFLTIWYIGRRDTGIGNRLMFIKILTSPKRGSGRGCKQMKLKDRPCKIQECRIAKVICYNCGQTGHLCKGCPKKRSGAGPSLSHLAESSLENIVEAATGSASNSSSYTKLLASGERNSVYNSL